MKAQKVIRCIALLSLTLALDGDRWLMPCPCHFKPRNDLVPIVCEAGWVPGAGWKGAEKLAHIRIQSPELPA